MKDKDLFDEISRQMDEAFARGDADFNDAMRRAQDLFERAKKTVKTEEGTIQINFRKDRWKTFCKLIGCAFEMLLVGRTTLTIRKR